MKKVQIIVRATTDFKRQVARVARQRKVSVNEFVISSLTRTLKREGK